MNDIIENAILQQQAVRFSYHGKTRVAEPFCYGADAGGEHVLRAYQISGYSGQSPPIGWRLFKVSEMQDIALVHQRFERRPGYDPGDPEMSKVFCKLG